MQYLGAIREREEALRQAEEISKRQGKTVKLERAKGKDYPNPKLYTVYRGWLDLDSTEARVVKMNF